MSTSNKSIPVSLPGPGNSRRIKNEKPQQGFKALLRLMRYLSSQRLMLLLILISLLLGTAGTLAGNYLLRPAINNYVLKKDLVGLGHIALVMIGIYIGTGIFNM